MNTLDQLLTDTARVDEPDSHTLARGQAMLDNALSALTVDRPVLVPGRNRGMRRRLMLAGAAAAAVAAVVTVPVVSLGRERPSATADAAAVLRAAGAAAGAQSGGWPDAAYWEATSTYVRDGATYDREIWIAHQAQSVLRDSGLPDPQTGVIDGRTRTSPAASDFDAGGTSLTWDELYALPTDPAQLRSTLQADVAGAGNDPTTELFVAIGDLLRESPASPELRRALYDVAAGIPGVQLTGRVTDGAGRTGTAVEYGGETYVLDVDNGQLLADMATGWTATYLSQGPADGAPTLP